MIVDGVDTGMDASPVDQGTAQLRVAGGFRSLAPNGTEILPSAVEWGPISGNKQQRNGLTV